jgi:hypothetical protein
MSLDDGPGPGEEQGGYPAPGQRQGVAAGGVGGRACVWERLLAQTRNLSGTGRTAGGGHAGRQRALAARTLHAGVYGDPIHCFTERD